MNYIKAVILISICCISFWGCKDAKVARSENSIVYTGIIDSVKVKDYFIPEEPFCIETTDNSLIMPSLIRVLEHDGIYYALDRTKRKVLGFDNSGHITCVINSVGSGPLEYVSVNDIAWDEDKDCLVLLAQNKLLYANCNGEIFDNMRLESHYHYISIINGTIFLSNSTYVNMEHADYSLTIYDTDGRTKQTLPTIEEFAPYCMVNGPELTQVHNRVLFSRKFDSNIYRIDSDGQYRPEYYIDWGDARFIPQNGSRYECDYLAKKCRDSNLIYAISDFQEGDEFMTFNSNLTGLMIMSKKNNTVSLVKRVIGYEGGVTLPNYIPVENSDGLVFFYMDSQYFSSFADKSGIKALQDMALTLDDESNPVILPYRLK